MSLPDVSEVMDYLRIEDEEEMPHVSGFIQAAIEELEDSGIKDQTTASYGLAIKLLVANYYEERRPQVVGTVVANLQYSLERIILRLKARELPKGDEV
ncbi:head-tail connector protein [Gracilibacillus dipsosauri]|jgi:hypothetical protein|uniref:head-tail connector protein n=1 Tax=Gracilibacillus dipsosauri TaxID=178340 RepID=UPI00240A7045